MIASTHTNHPLPASVAQEKPATRLQQACGRLKAAGLRITQPRIAILEALMKRSIPISIEQLHADLSASSGASCDLVTVYRCLAAFEELGLVRRCFFHNGASLYQLSLDDTPTYHVVDKAQDSVAPLDADLAEELQAALRSIEEKLAARGYDQVSHLVEFFGQAAHPASPVERNRSNVAMPVAE